ncbi:Hypothetical protein R9X50_00325100 [Acrodontium crateriforme]|uniref:UBC core domain-containing protein n=1 Tax=Acrodontium crateriforme TaxID=150365 RepID=A0AAQ3M381_9PEZI|nr:Hypothetical protein R9X50_00325100 [Acrodontium crateriforme]
MQTAYRFCAEDVVAHLDNLRQIGTVERTHEDVNTHGPFIIGRGERSITRHHDISRASFQRFQSNGIPPKGTVLVRWLSLRNPELIPNSALHLMDRSLLIGDIVKRNGQDAMSGVVLNTHTICTLQPVGDVYFLGDHDRPLKGLIYFNGPTQDLSLGPVPKALLDVPVSELQYIEAPTIEDLIVYRDWIGRVEDVDYHLTLKLMDNCVVEIRDDVALHADGETDFFYVGDIARTKKGHLRTGRWIYGEYNANTPPVGTVVRTRATRARVQWLQARSGSGVGREPPSFLESDELEDPDLHVYDRSRGPPISRESSMAQTVSNPEIDIHVGLRVRFKDFTSACAKYDDSTYHGKIFPMDRQQYLGYDLNVFDVLDHQSQITVQWQDQSITREYSIMVVPDTDVEDQHAAWPGEIASTIDFSPVPGMINVEQPSKVGVIQSVKSAERMASIKWCPNGLMHFARDPDQNNGLRTLVSVAVGAAEGEAQELSLYDVEARGEVNVCRGDIAVVARKTWGDPSEEPSMQNMEWLGQVVDTRLDGTLLLRLGAATPVQDVVVKREDIVIAIRSETTDQNNADGPFERELNYDSEDDDMYSDDEMDIEEFLTVYEDENGDILQVEDVEGGEWESDDGDEDKTMQEADVIQTASTPAPQHTRPVPSKALEQYLILDSDVPSSHHYSDKPPTPTPLHNKRTQKEHKILRSPGSLPEGIFVRTWECRLDLIRALFIGPEATPYANAPFIIDFYLPPDFPTQPPQAFFHSWPAIDGGGGRVNPNLYEDGKICTSILGTWEGAKGESWHAARSTLLQVIVSLLGLVLVPEPYFNEAGFEHLVGLEGSKRPAALYNERTFIRACGFAVTALMRLKAAVGLAEPRGLEGVADILAWLYSDASGPRLVDKVIGGIERVLAESLKSAGTEPDGKTVMSMGACVPLRRTLERLQGLR